MKKNNKKGFTLAELLIVVAIIAVLTAIAIPVFTGQLNKSKYAVDESNARSIYAEMAADFMAHGADKQSTKFKVGSENSGTVTIKGDKSKQPLVVTEADGTTNTYTFNGMAKIDFTLGSGGVAPKVTIAACDYNDNSAVVFGVTSVGG